MQRVPAPGYWILTATSRRRPSRQTPRCTWPMLAAAAGWSSNSTKRSRQSRAELLGEHPVHGGGRQRRGRLLQPGERLPVRPGELLGQGRLEDGQGLAELHGAALEPAQHPEQVFGGPLLDLGGDHLGCQPGDPLAQADRGPPGEAQRQAGQARGPADRPARYVVFHHPIVPERAQVLRSRKIQCPAPTCSGKPGGQAGGGPVAARARPRQ